MKGNSLAVLAAGSDAAGRSSQSIQTEINALNVNDQRLRRRLEELADDYDRAILASVADAEANEREAAVTKRGIRRGELQADILRKELEAAIVREQEVAANEQRAAAIAAVDAVLAKVDEHYRQPAEAIGRFLREWDAAVGLACKAGVTSPEDRLRFRSGSVEPAHEESYDVYIDEDGAETNVPYPPGSYFIEGDGGRFRHAGTRVDIISERPRRRKTRMVEEVRKPDFVLLPLAAVVNLPGAAIGDEPFWQGRGLAYQSP